MMSSTVSKCITNARAIASSLSLSSSRSSFSSSTTSSSSSSIIRTAVGFEAIGVRAGIKKKALALDFCLIRSITPCSSAAVFTQNQFCAAPVTVSRSTLVTHSDAVHGVVINAGCANACTGEGGLADARTTQLWARDQANMSNSLIMSTGVIGQPLVMEKIQSGFTSAIAALAAAPSTVDGWTSASLAVMTTDTLPKCIHRQLSIDNRSYTMSGICKGAGMIHPNMATLLGVIATDISISPECLKEALSYASERSFNSISIDGDTSTNDTVAVLANGQAEQWKSSTPKVYGISSITSPSFLTFRADLTQFCIDLAQLIVRDGEGATKFVTVRVSGGRNYKECKVIANSISTSMLVKTALFGQDANWGRILCAVGYAGIPIDTDKVNLFIRPVIDSTSSAASSSSSSTTPSSLHLVKNGQPFDLNESVASALFRETNIIIDIELGLGEAEATVWTCDLSIDYVKINADYRS